METDISNAQTDILNLGQNKADKSTTINGKDLSANRVIYAQDVPSKNLLPNNTVTQEINGVTFTVNADGTITATGTASASFDLTIGSAVWKSGTPYILTGCPSGGSNSTYRFTLVGYGYDYGDGYSFTGDGSAHRVDLHFGSGYAISGSLVFKPMIRPSTAPAGYVPYAKTNVELTNEVVIGTISNGTGWTLGPELTKLIKHGKVVNLSIGTTSSSAPVSQWNSIATIPSGFCPLYTLNGLVGVNNSNDDSVQFKITSSGVIQFYKKSDMTGATSVRLCCTYICQ